MKIYTNDLVKGHSDVKVKCLTFGLYTQVSDSGPLGPLVLCTRLIQDTCTLHQRKYRKMHAFFMYRVDSGHLHFTSKKIPVCGIDYHKSSEYWGR